MKTKMINDISIETRSKYKQYKGKEILLSEQELCSYHKNKYGIMLWNEDSNKSEPHFHIIDNKTHGEKVNAAYSMIDGKFIDHGSVISPVSNNVLRIIERMLKRKPSKNEPSLWEFIQFSWSLFNESNGNFRKVKHQKRVNKMPKFHNN